MPVAPPGWRAQARAAVLFAVYASFLLMATPGLDTLGSGGVTEEQAAEAREMGFPPWIVEITAALSRVNAARQPLERALSRLERPLRIGQSWNLYGTGTDRVVRMEIHLDGQLRYRSGDEAADWLRPVLRNRRLRPVVDTVATKPRARNHAGLARLIAQRALEENPQLQSIELVFTSARFPERDAKIVHRFALRPPEWAAELEE